MRTNILFSLLVSSRMLSFPPPRWPSYSSLIDSVQKRYASFVSLYTFPSLASSLPRSPLFLLFFSLLLVFLSFHVGADGSQAVQGTETTNDVVQPSSLESHPTTREQKLHIRARKGKGEYSPYLSFILLFPSFLPLPLFLFCY